MRWPALAFVALVLPAQAQQLGPTPEDIGVAYCLGVHHAHVREMRELTGQLCDHPQMRDVCAQGDQESEAERRRLAGYILGRGYASGHPYEGALAISVQRGDADAAGCASATAERCGARCEHGSSDQQMECVRFCVAQIPMCRQAQRCTNQDLLRVVP